MFHCPDQFGALLDVLGFDHKLFEKILIVTNFTITDSFMSITFCNNKRKTSSERENDPFMTLNHPEVTKYLLKKTCF